MPDIKYTKWVSRFSSRAQHQRRCAARSSQWSRGTKCRVTDNTNPNRNPFPIDWEWVSVWVTAPSHQSIPQTSRCPAPLSLWPELHLQNTGLIKTFAWAGAIIMTIVIICIILIVIHYIRNCRPGKWNPSPLIPCSSCLISVCLQTITTMRTSSGCSLIMAGLLCSLELEVMKSHNASASMYG